MQPEQRARLVEALPWLAEPEPGPAPPPRAVVPPPRPRRRGALALIGVLGVLAGGYAMRSAEPVVATAAPEKAAPTVDPADEWAARAEITLTSVDRQLDVIARTEQAWNASRAQRPGIAIPAAVAALQERRAVLERRRAAVASQLDSYQALSRTRADLQTSEERLDAVEDALQNPAAPTSPDDATTLAVLQEQRDLRVRQLDAKRAELAGLEGDVERAARSPLPDDGEATTAVSAQVLDAIHGDPPAPGRGPAEEHRAAGAHPRDDPAERRSTRVEDPRERTPQPAAGPRRQGPAAARHGERETPRRDAGRERAGTPAPASATGTRATAHPVPARRPSPHPRHRSHAEPNGRERPHAERPGRERHGEAAPARHGAGSSRGHAAVTKRDHEHTERSRSTAGGRRSATTGPGPEPARPSGSGCSDASGAREAAAGASH